MASVLPWRDCLRGICIGSIHTRPCSSSSWGCSSRRRNDVYKSQSFRLFLRNLEDPMAYLGAEAAANLPSFWNFPELKDLVGVGGLKMVSFDQGRMGHIRRKPTTVMGNLLGLGEFHGLRSPDRKSDPLPGRVQDSIEASRECAAWSPRLVAALKEALKVYLRQRDQCLAKGISKLTVEDWKKHVAAQHRPYRRDWWRCLELMGVDSPHRRSHADSSAYVLSIDLVGPYPIGRDDGRKRPGNTSWWALFLFRSLSAWRIQR